MINNKITNLKGIIPMIYCFFNKNGSIDKVLMKEQINTISKMKVNGMAALGLGTEVNKLSFDEKKLIIEIMSKENTISPIVLTIHGKNKNEYIRLIEHAKSNNVDWIILQPLITKKSNNRSCFNFFQTILPYCEGKLVGIQNAKEYLGVGLNSYQIHNLYNRFNNFRAIKAESSAVNIKREIKNYPKDLTVFNGRGGQEIIENILAGCAGIIPTPECSPTLNKTYKYILNKKYTSADKEYKKILPTIVFIMQSIDTLTFYGKRIFAKKLGINNVYDRKSNLYYDDFGKKLVKKFASELNIN